MVAARDLLDRLGAPPLHRVFGRVSRVTGLLVEALGLPASIGDLCRLSGTQERARLAEAVGFRDDRLLLMPLGDLAGVAPGDPIWSTGQPLQVSAGRGLLGRVLGPLGEPLDGGPRVEVETRIPLRRDPPPAMSRPMIRAPLVTGVRAIDGVLTCGQGQRMGIFAGSGIGKSTLLGMIARSTEADVNIIGLVGERGREVQEFIQRDLGPQGLARSIVVVATSDAPALLRRQAAFVATSLAEYFRDQGRSVLLMIDSLTRFAMAQREIGLAIGEPPTTRGYPPSAFALLPQLLERAGPGAGSGSITALYTVLVEGDDMNEPVADAARAILDGHIVLGRALADRGHYPPIDILASVSRVMPHVTTATHREAAGRLREALGAARDVEDLVRIGAYVAGSDATADWALAHRAAVTAFLQQAVESPSRLEETVRQLERIWHPQTASQKRREGSQ
ncbi:MAG TPA: FliI/YscN family ATPase [Candidatus Baltobacteraceae bacterium]|nr:FliI/YscN family ATPase [Candidatus Baltobacteraceae bacterium]